MTNALFLLGLATVLAVPLATGIRNLWRERWQFLATMPRERDAQGEWRCLNLTWYGFIIACSGSFACLLFFVLMNALGMTPLVSFGTLGLLIAICMPSARIVALIVERKRHTNTMGGASFVGMLLLPWVVLLADRLSRHFGAGAVPLQPTMAGLVITYAISEGLGRLGCISFGCCYGRPLADCPAWARRLVGNRGFVYHQHTRKAVYASGHAGVPLFPIQAVTAVVLCLISIGATALYLASAFRTAFLVAVIGSQAWRWLSEWLRDDPRGRNGKRFSAYQAMSLIGIVYSVVFLLIVGAGAAPEPNVVLGLRGLWSPGVILFIAVIWFAAFMQFGRSGVTEGHARFTLREDRV